MNSNLFYGKTPEILIADDTLDSLKLLSETLSRYGYDVRSVNNGTLAYESVKAAKPDLILLDIRMPDLSGYEVCQKLKNNPDTCDIPVIFISALNESFDKVEAFAKGGIDYITKPFQIEEVLARIQSHLALHFSTVQTQNLNNELERRVQARTTELMLSNQQLQQEIIERAKIEQNLRESEAKFRQISEYIKEVFWLINYDAKAQQFSNVEYISPAFATIWGQSHPLQADQLEWPNSVLVDDRDWVEALFQKYAALGKFDAEYRILTQDGSIRWIHDRGFPIINQDGVVYRVAGIAEDITARKQNEKNLSFLASIVEFSNDAIITKDLNGIVTSWNQGAEHLFGYTEAEILGKSIKILIPSSCHEEEIQILNRLQKGEKVNHFETMRLHKHGYLIEVAITISVLKDNAGKIFGFSKIVRDITLQKKAERERDRVFNLSLDLLFIADQEGNFKRLNPVWLNLLGYQDEELKGKKFWELIHPEDLAVVENQRPRLNRGHDIQTLEIRCLCKNGSSLWTAWNIVPFLEEKLLYGAGRNISQRKESEQRLVHETLHDALTGLANRVCFMQQLEMAIKKEKRYSDNHFAVLFIDLDNFKHINDTLGHLIGDQLLIQIARVLEDSVREVDIVARLGGDEFLILLEDFDFLQDIFRIVERIQDHLKSSFYLGHHEIFSSASIGIVVGTAEYQKAADVIRDADIAMYRAKAQGRGCYAVFDQEMYAETLREVELENALRQAIANQEFRLYYQPIVNLKNDLALEGFEVLLRWYHPEKGLIPASDFIPVAEDTGEILAIDQWVFHQACLEFQQLRSLYENFENLYFSINISGRQLRNDLLLETLKGTLDNTNIPSHSIKLEITESSFINNTDAAAKMLKLVRSQGIQISLDDFGTGYSSLRYLHQFPIDVIKIDRSFVKTLNQGSREQSIIYSIIMLAKALDFRTVAEGIETQSQLDQLRVLGCDGGQGYFFSRPMANQQLVEFLACHGFTKRTVFK